MRKLFEEAAPLSCIVLLLGLSTFVSPAHATPPGPNNYRVDVNLVLALKSPSGSAITGILQAHAIGTADALSGSLLLSPIIIPPGPITCTASLTGDVQQPPGPNSLPTFTLTGTLVPPGPSQSSGLLAGPTGPPGPGPGPSPSPMGCIGGVQGVQLVMVGFQDGDLDNPIVIGSNWNGVDVSVQGGTIFIGRNDGRLQQVDNSSPNFFLSAGIGGAHYPSYIRYRCVPLGCSSSFNA